MINWECHLAKYRTIRVRMDVSKEIPMIQSNWESTSFSRKSNRLSSKTRKKAKKIKKMTSSWIRIKLTNLVWKRMWNRINNQQFLWIRWGESTIKFYQSLNGSLHSNYQPWLLPLNLSLSIFFQAHSRK